MRINKFSLQHRNAFVPKEIDLSSRVIIIHSNVNSTGKTTLLRAILFALGFPVPNTELVHFEDFEFFMDLTNNNANYTISRTSKLLTINEQEFDLPVEQRAAHSFLLE